ncbi:Non-specific lipid transfer protein GPI-anchored 5 [Linum perenne]
MAGRNMAMSLGIVLLTMQLLAGGARAQSDCTNVLISLSPCLNYITGNSSTPSQQCCGQFATVVRTSPLCLCQLLNGGGSSFGVNINRTRALELPRACNVQTPPVSRCNGLLLQLRLLREAQNQAFRVVQVDQEMCHQHQAMAHQMGAPSRFQCHCSCSPSSQPHTVLQS